MPQIIVNLILEELFPSKGLPSPYKEQMAIAMAAIKATNEQTAWRRLKKATNPGINSISRMAGATTLKKNTNSHISPALFISSHCIRFALHPFSEDMFNRVVDRGLPHMDITRNNWTLHHGSIRFMADIF